MRIAAATIALLLVPVPAAAAPVITNEGIGTLKVGMAVTTAAQKGWLKASETGCNGGWEVARFPTSVYAGVWDDAVKVVATQSPRFATSRGIRVGDSRARLQQKYPRARVVSRNIYDNSPILATKAQGLHFVVRNKRVVMIEVVADFRPNGTEFEC